MEFFLTNETALLLTKEVDRFGLSSPFVPKFCLAERATYLNVQWAQFKQNNLRDIAYSIKTYFNLERIF